MPLFNGWMMYYAGENGVAASIVTLFIWADERIIYRLYVRQFPDAQFLLRGGVIKAGLRIHKTSENIPKLPAPEIPLMNCAVHTDKADLGAAFLKALHQLLALGKADSGIGASVGDHKRHIAFPLLHIVYGAHFFQ